MTPHWTERFRYWLCKIFGHRKRFSHHYEKDHYICKRCRKFLQGGIKMKAYRVYDPGDWDGFEEIVFADNAKEAKKKGFKNELFCDSEWIDVKVNRLSCLDGMESLTHKELMYAAITLCGWWIEDDGNRYDEENIDEAIEKGIVKPFKTMEESE